MRGQEKPASILREICFFVGTIIVIIVTSAIVSGILPFVIYTIVLMAYGDRTGLDEQMACLWIGLFFGCVTLFCFLLLSSRDPSKQKEINDDLDLECELNPDEVSEYYDKLM